MFEFASKGILNIFEFRVGSSSPGKIRGAFWFCLGVLCMMIFDLKQVSLHQLHESNQQHQNEEQKHAVHYVLSWAGLSQHEVILIIIIIIILILKYLIISLQIQDMEKTN